MGSTVDAAATPRRPLTDGATKEALRAPVIVAPMFLVSGPDLVVESCRGGLVGSFPTQNARTFEDLVRWLDAIRDGVADLTAPSWAVSMIVHKSYDRFAAELELMQEYRPDVVVTALGSPKRVLDEIHGYGGAVFADVMSVEHARKAADAGADGLVLVCHGAGGHTGRLSPFAFVDEVRRFYDGTIVVGGAVSTGRAVRAVEVLGADYAYMGTRFIACRETLVNEAYRDMLVRARVGDVTATAAVTGVLCSWLTESLKAVGFDEEKLASAGTIDFSDVHGEHKPWKDIFGAGQGVGEIDSAAPVAEVADRIVAEYEAACGRPVPAGVLEVTA
ncbi:nitronate monooxygenase [Pseudonocardia sp. RS11V-5]|uniref:NAD(P)H-dependent flavin oxidoreductase n=1 Tax=Pseudonocardia terrae TaxID=2905831 RepID=UPI001E441811|nr:nitronate monooxygenase [Pseudonocardia terrae]MCE3551096.1 nitronate monooxygenase [Pseudonocardia terrae]